MKHPIPQAALGQHMAILGKTGSGKTSTEKLAVEQVVADGFRVCVLDSVKSDWWGITSSANGRKPGLAFKILGGPHGHVPLHSSAGKVIGQLVGSGQLPLSIIDMADFEPGGLQRFFIDFAPALMRSAKGVVYLVIEEAHEFAPKERSGIGAENMAIHWAKKLATAGRSKGVRLIVATQRIQSLHNAVLGSCETIIAHRLTTPADQGPVIKWLQANTDKETVEKVSASLSSLPTGTGWLCSGEAKIFERVAFPKFHTYDNTATPTGDDAAIEVKTAPVDQEELRALIGEAVKEAEANDPKALRAEVARLTSALAAAHKNAPSGISMPDAKVIAAARAEGFNDGQASAAEWVRSAWRDAVEAVSTATSQAAEKLLAKGPPTLTRTKKTILAGPVAARTPAKPPAQNPVPRQAASPASLTLIKSTIAAPASSPPGGMLDVLVTAYPFPLPAILWGLFTGRSPVSGPWHKAVGELKAAGLVDGRAGGYVATERALEQSTAKPAGIQSEVDVWRHWRDIFASAVGDSAMALLGELARHHPQRLTARQLGLLTGRSPVSGPWHAAIKQLKKWDCIDLVRDSLGITEKGVQLVGQVGGGNTAAELRRIREERLSSTAHRIYDVLPGTRVELAKKLGMSPISGPWHGAVKELLGSGLAAEASDRTIAPIEEALA